MSIVCTLAIPNLALAAKPGFMPAASANPSPIALPWLPTKAEPEIHTYQAVHPARVDIPRSSARSRRQFTLESLDRARQESLLKTNPRPGQPLQIGLTRKIPGLTGNADAHAALAWEKLAHGGHVAAIEVASPEAAGLRLGLRIYALPAESRVRVFAGTDAPGHEITGREILGQIERNRAAGDLGEATHMWWSPATSGGRVILEVELPDGIDPGAVQIAVPHLSHLFALPFTLSNIGSANACTLDATCYQSTWDDVSRATAHATFVVDGNTYMCTGTLLADRDTSSSIPYFLTANHCISTQTVASSLETHWFFRSRACADNTPSSEYQVVGGGATLLHASEDTDSSFLRLQFEPPAGAVFAGWSAGTPALMSAVTGLHHPHGDLQKISFGTLTDFANCSTIPGSEGFYCETASDAASDHYIIPWSQGITEPGSSGSGLFLNAGQYLVGTLHGGSGSCGTARDFYGRFDKTYYAHLYHWLAATSSATHTLNVTRDGNGNGIVAGTGIQCGTDCSENHIEGTRVTLTATPSAGSIFSGWKGACENSSGSCVVTMNSAQSVVATFILSSEMTLRDAIYLYNKPIYSNAVKAIMGYHCDAFQMLLDVGTGFTDIAIYETTLTPYPDRIFAEHQMFSYALYSQEEIKAFGLWDNSEWVPDSQVGSATFFGYCYSSKPDAFVLMYDGANETCTLPNGSIVDCSEYGVSKLKSPLNKKQRRDTGRLEGH
jgi:hypothetical protein